jgi:hypothetical protein
MDASRGAAFGDIDNDGDTDVIVANGAGPVRLLMNTLGSRQHWIGLRLVSTLPSSRQGMASGVRDMVGARVAILRPGAPTLWRHAHADGSYASSNDPRVLVGLGASTEKPHVRVTWPDGRVEDWPSVAIDRYTTLSEGSSQ